MYMRRRSGSAAGQFSQFCCRFIPRRLLNRFNVVVVNGHDDIKMWTIGPANYTTPAIRHTAIGLELEEAFTLNVNRTERDVGFNSS